MQYQVAFPDYDPATLPLIPADWIDTSWANATCPSFKAPNGLEVYVDYLDPQQRECAECGESERFSVLRHLQSGGVQELLHSNDWQAVVSFVASYGA